MRERAVWGSARRTRALLVVLCAVVASACSGPRTAQPSPGPMFVRDGATRMGPACDAFTIGVTTMDEVLAAVGTRPESLQRLAGGDVLVCWYSRHWHFDPDWPEADGSFDYFLQCRFDAAGLLTWCRQRGPTPVRVGFCICGRAEERD